MGRKIIDCIPPYQPTVAVLIAILYLTLLPQTFGEEDISLFDGADKVVHFIMFGGLTGTYIFDRFRISRPLHIRGALWVALCSSLIGVAVEYLQYAMQMGRTGNDIYDVIANTIGSICAVVVCRMLHWVNVVVDTRA